MKFSENISKIKELFCSLRDKFKHLLSQAERVFFREMKEQDLHNIWKYLGSFKIERDYKEEGRIFLCVVSIFFLVTVIAGGNLIFAGHFRLSYEIRNAQAKESPGPEIGENSGLNTDIGSANNYKIESSEKICLESKDKKKSSDLCGKDDEEELKKIAEEERMEQARRLAASKPRVVRLSCQESNYGHPHKSDTKGPHMDEDCCPDPDEWPNPRCVYDAHGYGLMLKGPPKKK